MSSFQSARAKFAPFAAKVLAQSQRAGLQVGEPLNRQWTL